MTPEQQRETQTGLFPYGERVSGLELAEPLPTFSGGGHPYADIARLVLIVLSAVLAMITVRVAYLRKRRNAPSWPLLSYALFIAVTVIYSLRRFGEPVDWLVAGLDAVGIVMGLVGGLSEVSWRGHQTKRHWGHTDD